MNAPDFWDNQEKANSILAEVQDLRNTIKDVDDLNIKINDLNDLMNTGDSDALSLIEEELPSIEKDCEKLELLLLLSGEYDKNNAILEVHSGAGGTEACDWAYMIYRMYIRWIESKGYSYTILDFQEGDEVGLKSSSILVKGLYAYGYLKCEKGVHS